ncbi:MAG: hypothetical protein GX227_04765 [Clostridiaceae bacterium]|jgi:hypothetical protein|nr:hypothetical protein [Clostridiaceae bacterium]
MFWEFLAENWAVISAAAIVVVYLVYLTITKQWTRIREFAYQVMLLAERTFGDENGKIKFDFVVRIVFKNLPAWLKLFIHEDDIKKLIQTWYDKAKDFLDDGQFNESM